jgi:hypothetical protein
LEEISENRYLIRPERDGIAAPLLYIGERYQGNALSHLFSEVEESFSQEDFQWPDLQSFARAESTLRLMQVSHELKERFQSIPRIAAGCERLERVLSEYYQEDYGRQVQQYIQGGNFGEAGLDALEGATIHMCDYAKLADLLVEAFAVPFHRPDHPKAADRTLETLEMIGSEVIEFYLPSGLKTLLYAELLHRSEQSEVPYEERGSSSNWDRYHSDSRGGGGIIPWGSPPEDDFID